MRGWRWRLCSGRRRRFWMLCLLSGFGQWFVLVSGVWCLSSFLSTATKVKRMYHISHVLRPRFLCYLVKFCSLFSLE